MLHRRTQLAGLVAMVFAAACASAGGGSPDGGAGDNADARVGTPDAPIGFPDAAPGTPDAAPGTPDAAPGAPDAGPVTTTLTQTTSDTIAAQNSVACVNSDALDNPLSTALNRYFRVFDLAAEGITSAFTITQVTIGVESATATGGNQTATVLVYTVSGTGTPTLGSLTQVASQAITIVDQTQQLLNVAISATIPAGARFAIELSSPDGPNNKFFFFGSNAAGESSPAYMVAPGCGINEMSAADPLNSNNTMHLVMKVTGSHVP